MTKMVTDIKTAKNKYGFSLKQAYEYVKGERDKRDPITSLYHKNQNTIDWRWMKIKYPHGMPGTPKPIVDAPYGQHIEIYCKNCKAFGNTKNISPIGCRTLFINCSCYSIKNIITTATKLTNKDFEAKI